MYCWLLLQIYLCCLWLLLYSRVTNNNKRSHLVSMKMHHESYTTLFLKQLAEICQGMIVSQISSYVATSYTFILVSQLTYMKTEGNE